MIKKGIFILSLLPLSALSYEKISSADLLKICEGKVAFLDEGAQSKIEKLYDKMKPEEKRVCTERGDDYRNYLIKKYSSDSVFR